MQDGIIAGNGSSRYLKTVAAALSLYPKPKVVEAITQDNKELRQFVDMCFDPASPVSEKLRETLTKLLEEQRK